MARSIESDPAKPGWRKHAATGTAEEAIALPGRLRTSGGSQIQQHHHCRGLRGEASCLQLIAREPNELV